MDETKLVVNCGSSQLPKNPMFGVECSNSHNATSPISPGKNPLGSPTGARQGVVSSTEDGLVELDTGSDAVVLLERKQLSSLAKAKNVMDAAMIIETGRRMYGEAALKLSKEVNVFDHTSFRDITGLSTWLNAHGINTMRWGTGKTKSVESLYNEIEKKLSVLILEKVEERENREIRIASPTKSLDPRLNRLSSPANEEKTQTEQCTYRVFRYVRVVRASVKQEFENRKIRYLLESSQEIGSTGKVKYRSSLLSSLMQHGEGVFTAVKRATSKELQCLSCNPSARVLRSQVLIPKRDNIVVHLEDIESPSYPGLLTRYILYTCGVMVEKTLPKTDFVSVEYLETGHVSVKHHWKWKTKREIEEIMKRPAFSKDAPVSTILMKEKSAGSGDSPGESLLYDITCDDFTPASDFVGEGDAGLLLPSSLLRTRLQSWSFTEEEMEVILSEAEQAQKEGSLEENKEGEEFVISKQVFTKNVVPLVKKMVIAGREQILANTKLTDEHLAVLTRLFPGCCRINPKILHGGFSGSFVLQVSATAPGSLGKCAKRLDPTVVKLDNRETMKEELNRYHQLSRFMNDCAPAVLNADVDPDDISTGGIVFELVGAVWMLPDFHQSNSAVGDAHLLNTFKTLFLHEMSHEVLPRMGKLPTILYHDSDDMEDLKLNVNPKEDNEEAKEDEVFGNVLQVLKEVFGEILRKTTLMSQRVVEYNLLSHYGIVSLIHNEVLQDGDDIRVHKADMNLLDPDGSKREVFRMFLTELESSNALAQTNSYLEGLVHGDLNGMNILIDSQDIVWIIDFNKSGFNHVVKDIAKVEACILYEYTEINSDEEYQEMKAIVDSLLVVRDLREKVKLVGTNKSSKMKFVWESVQTLRMYAGNYTTNDPEPIQMVVAMLYFALRALHFRDITDKRVPFYVASKCVQILLENVNQLKPDIEEKPLDNIEIMNQHLTATQMEYEKRRYFHDIFVRESYVIDVITRERVYINEQTVELELVDSGSRDRVIEHEIDVDEMQAQRRLQKRLDALQGVLKQNNIVSSRTSDIQHSRFTSAMQVLGVSKQKVHRVLLGGAASGKSCLMRKMLLSTVNEQSGSPDDVIPVLILLIELGRLMTKQQLDSRDDLLDHYLVDICGTGSARLAFFRQERRLGNLMILLDGLDEAGDHRREIETYIAKLSKTEGRITVSSRVTGFNDSVFREFHFYQVMPLTVEMQNQIIETRLGNNHVKLPLIRTELRRPQYAEIVRNPLMLSLLVSLLSKKLEVDPQKNQTHYTRAFLYKHAVAQMLHQSSMNKFGMRRGLDDKLVENWTKVLASQACYNYLKALSYYAHCRKIRDVSPKFLTDIADSHIDDEVYYTSTNKNDRESLLAQVYAIIEILQSAVFDGRCGLFAVSKVAATGSGKNGRFNYVMRFVHLSFQEYLAGLYIVDHLKRAKEQNKLEEMMNTLVKYKSDQCILHEPWWQMVLITMAGSMSAKLFYSFAKLLLSLDDATGANVFLCAEMLAEIPESAFEDVSLQDQVGKLMRDGFSAYVKECDLVSALIHQSRHLQHLALMEVRRFYDPIRAAYAVVYGAGVDVDTVKANPPMKSEFIATMPWYSRVATARALGLIPEVKNEDLIIGVLLDFWVDDSSAVQLAGVEAIKTLGAENHRLVVQEVIRQMRDEIETSNAHELILALELQHSLIVEELLANTAPGSEFYCYAIQTLKQMSPTPELLDYYCRAVGHSVSADIRRNAAELIVMHEPNGVSEALETAMIKWLEDPDGEMATRACETLKQLNLISSGLTNALKSLIAAHSSSCIDAEFIPVLVAAMDAFANCFKNHKQFYCEMLKREVTSNHPSIRCQVVRLLETLDVGSLDEFGRDMLSKVIEEDGDLSVKLTSLHVANNICTDACELFLKLAQSTSEPDSFRKLALQMLIDNVEDSNLEEVIDFLSEVCSESDNFRRVGLAGLLQVGNSLDSSVAFSKFHACLNEIIVEHDGASCLDTLLLIGDIGENIWSRMNVEQVEELFDNIINNYVKVEDEDRKREICTALDTLVEQDWVIENGNKWLQWFSTLKGDIPCQCTLIGFLPAEAKSDDSVVSVLIDSLGSETTDRRLRSTCGLALHEWGLWETRRVIDAFHNWLLKGSVLDTFDALEFLRVNHIPVSAESMRQLIENNNVTFSMDATFQRQTTREKINLVLMHRNSKERASRSVCQAVSDNVIIQKSISKNIEQLAGTSEFSEEELLGFLESENPHLRLVSCTIVEKGKTNPRRAWDILFKRLFDGAKGVYAKVIADAICKGFRRKITFTNKLGDAILHSNPLVRRVVLTALSDICVGDAISIVRSKALDDEVMEVRNAAVELLLDWRKNAVEKDVSRIDQTILRCLDDKNSGFLTCLLSKLSAVSVDLFRKLWTLLNVETHLPIARLAAEKLLRERVKSIEVSNLFELECETNLAKQTWISLAVKILGRVFRNRRRGRAASSRNTLPDELCEKLVRFTSEWLVKQGDWANRKIVISLFDLFLQYKVRIGMDVVASLLEDRCLISKMLDYMLTFSHVSLTFDIITAIPDFMKKSKIVSANCLRFFAEYTIKSYEEAEVFVDCLGERTVAAFLIDPLLNFFRTKRAYNGPKTRWSLPTNIKAKLDNLLLEGHLEASYLSKELRVQFEVKEVSDQAMHHLSLKGQADIREQRCQRQEQKMMHKEEWDMQRAKWFPPSPLDLKVMYMSTPDYLKYQMSSLSVYRVNFYISYVGEEFSKEVDILCNEVFPEVNRRLSTMGVMVQVNPCVSKKEDDMETRLRKIDECAPFVISLVGEKYGTMVDEFESVQSLERKHAFSNRPYVPTHALIYMRDSAFLKDMLSSSEKEHFMFEYKSNFKLQAQYAIEKRDMKTHAYAKVCRYQLNPNQPEEMNEGEREAFYEMVVEDCVVKLLSEFCIHEVHQVKEQNRSVDLVNLPFIFSEEQRFHEKFLLSRSCLNRHKQFDKMPRTRSEVLNALLDIMRQHVQNDIDLRHERRAVTNERFLTKDEELGNKVVLVSGKTCSGKSTTLATFADLYRKSVTSNFVLFHSCGSSVLSTRPCFTLLRLIIEVLGCFPSSLELNREFDIPNKENLRLENVKSLWEKVLLRASEMCLQLHYRIVLVVDDLGMQGGLGELLPMLIPEERFSGKSPPGISVILSCDEKEIEEFRRQENCFSVLNLESSIAREEQVDLVDRIVSRYNLTLDKDIVNSMLAKPNAGNVFYLKMLCVELLNTRDLGQAVKSFPNGMFAVGDAKNLSLRDMGSEGCMFDPLMDRVELEFGFECVGSVLTVLALIEQVEEHELMEMASLLTPNLSLQTHQRLILWLDSILQVVPVFAQSLGNSTNKKGRRYSLSGRRFSHYASRATKMYGKSLAVAKKAGRVLQLSNKGFMKKVILERYANISVEKVHGCIAKYLVNQLKVHSQVKPEFIDLRTHLLCRRVMFHALNSGDHTEQYVKSIMAPDVLHGLFSQTQIYYCFDDLINDLDEGIQRTEKSLKWYSERISSNRAEIIKDPSVIKELF